MSVIEDIARKTKLVSSSLLELSEEEKNRRLFDLADRLEARFDDIMEANQCDLEIAESTLSPMMLDRLRLTSKRFLEMVDGVRYVASLPDPVWDILDMRTLESGILLQKQRVPIGVIAIIYEARPNVTVDSAVLCFKAGNAVILRGGKEAKHTNMILAEIMDEVMPFDTIKLIESSNHDDVIELVQQEKYIDLVIPRGGENLIRSVVEHSRIPVLKHYKGVCHIYVSASADFEMALSIIQNAKCSRPGVCNAVETVLIDEEIAEDFFPLLESRMNECGVKMHLKPEDWSHEYLAKEMSVKFVPDTGAAIAHINKFGSHHSDAIITQSEDDAMFFREYVDSAAVYVNASTRFTDGGCFGLGAEIGICTDKIHARGPMGLTDLTTYKYLLTGDGHIRV